MIYALKTPALVLATTILFGCAVNTVETPARQATAVSAVTVSTPTDSLRTARLVPTQQSTKFVPTDLVNGDASSSTQLALIKEINKTRAKHGLKALRLETSLMDAAQSYARTLSNIGDIDHIGPNGDKPGDRARDSGYSWGFIAENLASGQDSPELTVSDWMKSPAHRDALLHVDPIHIGVGHVTNPSDPNYKEYWVMLVGTPLI